MHMAAFMRESTRLKKAANHDVVPSPKASPIRLRHANRCHVVNHHHLLALENGRGIAQVDQGRAHAVQRQSKLLPRLPVQVRHGALANVRQGQVRCADRRGQLPGVLDGAGVLFADQPIDGVHDLFGVPVDAGHGAGQEPAVDDDSGHLMFLACSTVTPKARHCHATSVPTPVHSSVPGRLRGHMLTPVYR